VKTILVAYDDTDPSRRALARATTLAEAFGSRLIITSVSSLHASSPKSAAERDHSQHRADHDAVVRATSDLKERGLQAESIEATGDPAGAIARLAEDQNVDLVVVGTREVGAMQRLLGMSVSQAVAKRVHCDVLIVHPEHTPAT
jgi:nucleotide-binding universal stress UspA family protein